MNIITLSAITVLLFITFIFCIYKAKKVINTWVEAYNINSQFYKLNVSRMNYQNNYRVKTREIFAESKTFKGATETYYYRDSIFFYEKIYRKYFSIESYQQSWLKISERKYKSPEIFSIDLSGEVIMAWINKEDMENELLGTKVNPIRIFKLEYDSAEYLDDLYFKNLQIFKQNFRADIFLAWYAVIPFLITPFLLYFGVKFFSRIFEILTKVSI